MTVHSPQRVAYRYLVSESGFNLTEFRNLQPDSMPLYLQEHARKLGGGHSRVVYDIGNKTVLKLAIRGQEQANLIEAKVSKCNPESKVLAPVLDYDNNGLWLTMVKVKPISGAKFKKMLYEELKLPENLNFKPTEYYDAATNVFDRLSEFITGDYVRFYSEEDEISASRLTWAEDHPSQWWTDFKKAVTMCHIPIDDLLWENFGDYNGHLVILDYGS